MTRHDIDEINTSDPIHPGYSDPKRASSKTRDNVDNESLVGEAASNPEMTGWKRVLYNPWAQLLLISFICFCDPGMYNSISGIGGSGQLDPTVAANATVALLASTAAAALTIVPTIFDMFGPRGCLLMSGWTYPLYAGSLWAYNHTQNSAFVVASGAILGIGTSLSSTLSPPHLKPLI
jgi:hypothetical protein